MDKRVIAVIAAIAIAVPAAAVAVMAGAPGGQDMAPEPQQMDDRPVVVASVFHVYDFALQVAGDRAEVRLASPLSAEPHDWDPTVREIQAIQSADLLLVNGLGLETWLPRIGDAVPVADTSKGIELIYYEEGDHDEAHGDEAKDDDHGDDDHGDEAKDEDHGDEDHGDEDHADEAKDDDHGDEDGHGHEPGSPDPHIWLDPSRAAMQVRNIAGEMGRIDPENAQYYRANADAYAAKLDMLDAQFMDRLDGCATGFLTYHEAFSYMAARYGLTEYALTGPQDPHGEPTPGALVRAIEAEGVAAVFMEESANPRALETVAGDVGVSLGVISAVETGPGGYLERMQANMDALAEGLC